MEWKELFKDIGVFTVITIAVVVVMCLLKDNEGIKKIKADIRAEYESIQVDLCVKKYNGIAGEETIIAEAQRVGETRKFCYTKEFGRLPIESLK